MRAAGKRQNQETETMKFMNEMDIEEKVRQFQNHPVMGPAARFLRDFKDEVNSHSDGWPYWRPPVQAARQLMTLFDTSNPWDEPKATEADVKRALGPIKAFMTRRGNAAGMRLPALR